MASLNRCIARRKAGPSRLFGARAFRRASPIVSVMPWGAGEEVCERSGGGVPIALGRGELVVGKGVGAVDVLSRSSESDKVPKMP